MARLDMALEIAKDDIDYSLRDIKKMAIQLSNDLARVVKSIEQVQDMDPENMPHLNSCGVVQGAGASIDMAVAKYMQQVAGFSTLCKINNEMGN